MAIKGKKKGRAKRVAWSKEHVRDLKAHSKGKTPVAKISKAMKRTPGAIRQKALCLGISIGHRR
jgi:glyceraldehyde-3-phosphate dehydrogenase/erythrose-4-phosphate dehydrogenase